MIQIIPNLHPILVHFTVALFSASVGFYCLSYMFCQATNNSRAKHYSQEFETVSRWCLWTAALITLMTVAAGLSASTSVKHDEPSHLAMLTHRNWALPTAVVILGLACWSVWRYFRLKIVSFLFLIALLVGQGLLLSTAWHGAELVFRYGLGVISLPKAEAHHHIAAISYHEDPSMPQMKTHEKEMLLTEEATENHHDE